MVFNIILIILLFFAVLEMLGYKIPTYVVKIILSIITIITIFRYGIGVDYFNYETLYQNTKTLFKSDFWQHIHHGEPGFVVLCSLFKTIGFNFTFFNIVFSFVIMFFYSKFIIEKSFYPVTSILVFYSLYFMTYPFSTIRQAFAIILFLYYSLEFLYEKQYTHYFISIIILSLFHYSILSMIILPLVIKFKLNNYSFLIFLIVGVLFPLKFFVSTILPYSISQKVFIYLFAGISWNAIIIRIVFALPIILFLTNDKLREYPYLYYFKQLYLWGLIFYFLFYNASNMASRISVYLKSLDIILYPMIIYNITKKTNKLILFLYLMFSLLFMFYKNINSQIVNSPYFRGIYKMYSYPYFSIFNKNTYPIDKLN